MNSCNKMQCVYFIICIGFQDRLKCSAKDQYWCPTPISDSVFLLVQVVKQLSHCSCVGVCVGKNEYGLPEMVECWQATFIVRWWWGVGNLQLETGQVC